MERQQTLALIWTALSQGKYRDAFDIADDYNTTHDDEIFMEEDDEWIAVEDDVYYLD